MRFDLPPGHDLSAKVEPVAPGTSGKGLDHLLLCHSRCTAPGLDHTGLVTERVRRRNEAALFARARKKAA